jgi:hypothetical protein
MQDASSPSRALAEHLLQRSLADYVGEKRAARPQWSWRLIAEQISADTDGKVNLSGEAIRRWFAETEVAA